MDNTEYEKAKKFIAKLKTVFNPKIIKVETKHDNAIVLTFIRTGYIVLISPREALNPYYAFAHSSFENLTLIYDKDYQSLKGIINKNPVLDKNKDPTRLLESIYSSFKKSPKPKLIDWLPYSLRKESEHFNKLSLSVDQEFFFYSSDELVHRYRQSKGKYKLKKNQKVKIIDDSALIFTNKDGTRTLDLHLGTKHLDEKFLYLDTDLTEQIEVEEGDEYNFMQLGEGPGNSKYFKTVLKNGVNVKTLKNKIPYVKANKKEFDLVKKGKEYFLKDNKGLISISHPDLLVYML